MGKVQRTRTSSDHDDADFATVTAWFFHDFVRLDPIDKSISRLGLMIVTNRSHFGVEEVEEVG